jgi:hypothetical protein
MWWLSYRRSGRPYCVGIIEGSSLPDGGIFSADYPLNERYVSMLRPGEIGCMMSPQEAAALLDRFEGVAKNHPRRACGGDDCPHTTR